MILEDLFHWIIIQWLIKSLRRDEPILILDLDNTLVDTRKYQAQQNAINVFGESDFPSIPVKIKDFVAQKQDGNHQIVVLTARPYRHWRMTAHYIRNQLKLQNVILTRTAFRKLDYLKALSRHDFIAEYIDDLSHGVTTVNYYDDIIAKASNLPGINYRDHHWIKSNLLCD